MRTWVEALIEEYGDGKRKLEKYRKTLDQQDPDKKDTKIQDEAVIVDGMISDMRYAIEWMRRGKRPGNRRGIEATDAYKRAALLDMDLFPSLDVEPEESNLTDAQRKKIVRALLLLSARERQCYLLHMAKGLSHAEIGKELKISKNTARTFIDRAKSKIQQGIEG